MTSKKFNLTLPDTHRELIEYAADINGSDITEIVRTGAYLYAKLIVDGDVKKAMMKKMERMKG